MKPSGLIERRSIWRVGTDSTWTTIVPVVFIIVSLLSLSILPLVVSSKMTQQRRRIEQIAEPARQAANIIQTDLSGEVDKIIAFDPKCSDKMVTDLARGSVALLLRMIGDRWYTFRKKAKLLYYEFG